MDADELYLGVDAGSTAVKAVAIDSQGGMVAEHLASVSGDYAADIERMVAAMGGAGRFRSVVATGYAQDLVGQAAGLPDVSPASRLRHSTLSEISCHARGVHHLLPDAGLVIDIGGQDMKAIRIGPGGKPTAFQMNDKCAAGTGRFLEVMARALGVEVASMGELAAAAADPARISSMCAVFAESEVVTLVARGRRCADIAAGLLDSVAERVFALAARVGFDGSVIAVTGGVARNAELVAAVSRRLNRPVVVPEQPQFSGALGAALTARGM